MRKAALVMSLTILGGCSGSLQSTHKKAYITGAVTKNVVEEAHQDWSRRLNEQADKCERESSSTEEFDKCLGPFVHNDDVVIALEAYVKLAELLFEVLKDPDTTKERIDDVAGRAMDAAEEIFKLMPNSGAPAKLKSILGR